MLKADALKYFNDSKAELAKVAGVSTPSIYSWGDVVPEARAARLHAVTGGELKYDPDFYAEHDPRRAAGKK